MLRKVGPCTVMMQMNWGFVSGPGSLHHLRYFGSRCCLPPLVGWRHYTPWLLLPAAVIRCWSHFQEGSGDGYLTMMPVPSLRDFSCQSGGMPGYNHLQSQHMRMTTSQPCFKLLHHPWALGRRHLGWGGRNPILHAARYPNTVGSAISVIIFGCAYVSHVHPV